MGIRHITRDEYDAANEIKYIAFHRKPFAFKNDADNPDAIYHSLIGYYDEVGTMTACMRNIDYDIFFEGACVPACGITNVVSSPEARGRGRIREIFQYVFDEDRARGRLFSMLYPFSHVYYRQFGYALCAYRQTVRIPIEQLSPYAHMPMRARLHREADGFDAIRRIESRMLSRYNMAMLLTDRQYRKALGGDAYTHGDYRYILSDPTGTPCAYLYFTAESTDGACCAAIHALAYTDTLALQRVFGFLYGLRAQYAFAQLLLPIDIDLLQMLPEPQYAKADIVPYGMARILDVQAVLSRMRHPQGHGTYTLRVSDPFSPANEATYTVSYEHGRATVCQTQRQPDLIVDVGTLTQLVLGTQALDCVLWKESVSLLQNEQTLHAVFVQKPVYFPHHF